MENVSKAVTQGKKKKPRHIAPKKATSIDLEIMQAVKAAGFDRNAIDAWGETGHPTKCPRGFVDVYERLRPQELFGWIVINVGAAIGKTSLVLLPDDRIERTVSIRRNGIVKHFNRRYKIEMEAAEKLASIIVNETKLKYRFTEEILHWVSQNYNNPRYYHQTPIDVTTINIVYDSVLGFTNRTSIVSKVIERDFPFKGNAQKLETALAIVRLFHTPAVVTDVVKQEELPVDDMINKTE